MRSSRSKKKPAKKGPVQTRLVNDRGMLNLEHLKKHAGGVKIRQTRRPATPSAQQWTKASSRLPSEVCLLIAQTDPMVAIRLHSVNKWFRDLIKANVISMTQTRFLPGIEGLSFGNWFVKLCLGMLFIYFDTKMAACDDTFDDDVNSLKKHIGKRYTMSVPIHVRSWIFSLSDGKLATADARSYLMKVLKAARAHYGSLYLTLGDDETGTRRFALSFLAVAENILASQFRMSYDKITCNTTVLFNL